MEDNTRKAVFAWASIAGSDPEPVELLEEEGRKGIYTCGCADPFWLDDEAAGIIVYSGSPLERPANPETREQRDLREQKYNAKKAAARAAYEWHREHSNHGPDCEAGACNGTPYTHMWRGAR